MPPLAPRRGADREGVGRRRPARLDEAAGGAADAGSGILRRVRGGQRRRLPDVHAERAFRNGGLDIRGVGVRRAVARAVLPAEGRRRRRLRRRRGRRWHRGGVVHDGNGGHRRGGGAGLERRLSGVATGDREEGDGRDRRGRRERGVLA